MHAPTAAAHCGQPGVCRGLHRRVSEWTLRRVELSPISAKNFSFGTCTKSRTAINFYDCPLIVKDVPYGEQVTFTAKVTSAGGQDA